MRDRERIVISMPETASIPLQAPLPGAAGPFLKVFTCGPRDRVDGVILSPRLVSFHTHFVHPDTIPCLKPFNMPCQYCQTVSLRWQGWLAIYSKRHRRYGMSCITEGAARKCPIVLTTDGSLVGHRIVIERRGNHKRAQLFVDVSGEPEYPVKDEQMVTSEALVHALANLWGITFKVESEKSEAND